MSYLCPINADLSDKNNVTYIDTGYDTSYFDAMYFRYVITGRIVTVTGFVHAIATDPTYLGKVVATVSGLPTPCGAVACFPAYNSTAGGQSLVMQQYQTLYLMNFASDGWWRFNGSYLYDS